MRAAVFHGAEQGLRVEDVPTPEPGPGEARIRVAGCGVCHTDLHYLDHGTPTFKPPPLILGHEVAGVVDALGSGVSGPAPGSVVLVPAVIPCGACEACRRGRSNICANSVMLGNNIDGGFAEYLTVPARELIDLPLEIDPIEGCIIADALTTPYHAVVHRGEVRPGDRVVVIGAGGIGLNVVQMAVAVGARVVAVDLSEEKLRWAERLGAEGTLNPSSADRTDRELRKLTGGGANVAFEAVGRPETQQMALAALRPGGRIVLVGYSPDKVELNAGRIMFRELEIRGSLGCRPVDYPRVVDLVRRGAVQLDDLVTHRFPLAEIHDAFDTLRAGEAIRAVVIP